MPKKYNLNKNGRIYPPYGISNVDGVTFSFYPYKNAEGRKLVTKYPKGKTDFYGNQLDSTVNKTYYFLGRDDRKGIPALDSVKASGSMFKPDTLFYSDGAKIAGQPSDVFLDKNNNPVIIRLSENRTIGKKKINEINNYLEENAPVHPIGYIQSFTTGYGYPYTNITPTSILYEKEHFKRYGIPKRELNKNFVGPVISREFKLGGSKRIKAALGTQYPLIGGVQPLNFDVPTFTPLTPISPINTSGLTGNYRDLFNQNIRAGVLSTAISGLGRLGNYLAINSFKPQEQHTKVQAEQAEKAPTTYSINAQRDNLTRSIAQGTRDINNNTASSQVAEARRSILRNRGIGAFNNLYEGKLNRETEMLRADAQLRQGVRQRNTAALNTAVARDTVNNTNLINQSNLMKKQALGNLFTGLSSDSINTINQLGNSYYNLLNNQQQLDRDIATASLYFLANRNAGNLFTPDENGNSIYDNVYGNVRRAWYGKLGGYNSLIRR